MSARGGYDIAELAVDAAPRSSVSINCTTSSVSLLMSNGAPSSVDAPMPRLSSRTSSLTQARRLMNAGPSGRESVKKQQRSPLSDALVGNSPAIDRDRRHRLSARRHIDLQSRPLFPVLVELGFHSRLDFFVEWPVVFERFLGGIAALRELSAFVIQPGTTFLDDLFFQRKIEKRAGR